MSSCHIYICIYLFSSSSFFPATRRFQFAKLNHYSSIDFRRFHVTMFTLITAYIINYVTFLHATIETEPENDIIIVSFPNKISRSARNSFARPPYEPTPSPFPLQLPCSALPPLPSQRFEKRRTLARIEIFPGLIRSEDKVSLRVRVDKLDEASRWYISDQKRRKYAHSALRFGHSRDLSISVVRGRKKRDGGRGISPLCTYTSVRSRFFFLFPFFFLSFLRVGERLQIDERVCVYPVYIERGLGRYR